jgi:hypothetical protein
MYVIVCRVQYASEQYNNAQAACGDFSHVIVIPFLSILVFYLAILGHFFFRRLAAAAATAAATFRLGASRVNVFIQQRAVVPIPRPSR